MKLAFPVLLLSLAAPAQDAPSRHLQLDNGIQVLLWPISGEDQIGMQAIYRVGFIHEPDGMTQAAHLLEHLVCNAGTTSWKPRAAMKKLNEIGLANAETLPDWTHYDYVVPGDQLELVLGIEAERLTSLAIEAHEVAIEAPRCYLETDFVERNPRAGMSKHAMMALTQAWLHGRSRAQVRGGMEAFDPEALSAFHRSYYRPGNLTLILVGGFERERALALIEEHLGAIPARAERRTAKPDWTKAGPRHDVRWDAKVRAVCVACPPPESQIERVVLTLWAQQLSTALKGDAEVSTAARSVLCTNLGWSVGDLPFFAYVALNDAGDAADVARAIHRQLDRLLAAKPDTSAARRIANSVRMLAARIETMNGRYVAAVAKDLERRAGSAERARGMVLGQGALNWGMAFHLCGADADALAESIKALTPAQLHAILERNLARERRIVSTLSPE